jgi:hypothetical protein
MKLNNQGRRGLVFPREERQDAFCPRSNLRRRCRLALHAEEPKNRALIRYRWERYRRNFRRIAIRLIGETTVFFQRQLSRVSHLGPIAALCSQVS